MQSAGPTRGHGSRPVPPAMGQQGEGPHAAPLQRARCGCHPAGANPELAGVKALVGSAPGRDSKVERENSAHHEGDHADCAQGLGRGSTWVPASALHHYGGRQAGAGAALESKYNLQLDASGMVTAFSRKSSNMSRDRSKCRRSLAPISWPEVALTRSAALPQAGMWGAKRVCREPICLVCSLRDSTVYEDRDLSGCFRSWSCSTRMPRRPRSCPVSYTHLTLPTKA